MNQLAGQPCGAAEEDVCPDQGYTLDSELARLCLPLAFEDPNRRLAWVNSICLMFLAVGLVGWRAPEVLFQPFESSQEFIPIVDELPPPATEATQESVESQDVSEPPEEREVEMPELIRVLPAETPAAFVVPVEGPVILVPAQKYTSTPPAEPVKGNNTATPRVIRIEPGSREGRCPPPSYPPAALASGQQGRVLVQFAVDANGAVTSTEIKESSGYGTLDRHAAQWVKSKWQFPAGEMRLYDCYFVFQLN